MRGFLLAAWLLLLFSAIAYVFWYHEWKYALPTPVPANYAPVQTGELVPVHTQVQQQGNQPVFIHFFNPDCPCSRFNIEHFNSLVKNYGDSVSFSVVVINKNKQFTAEEVKDKFNITVPVLFDTTIATKCGVYSTPQAVILDSDFHLYYRGNYNKSRYCTEKNSNYAQSALTALLYNESKPTFGPLALKAYGCSLPTCTK